MPIINVLPKLIYPFPKRSLDYALGMSLLGMRRAPWLATISAALSLVGWMPWSALIGIDDLAYDITLAGSPPQLAMLTNKALVEPAPPTA